MRNPQQPIRLDDITVGLRRAVVAYFDVTGFMSWEKKSAVAHRDSSIFIRRMKFEFLRFQHETGHPGLDAGDGLIGILELLSPRDSVAVMSFIRDACRLIRIFEAIRWGMEFPRPGWLRVRFTAGAVYRTETPDPLDSTKMKIDWLGEPLNKAHRLLEVYRSMAAILDQSAAEELTPAARRILNLRDVPPAKAPRNVEPEDMLGLKKLPLRVRA